MNRFLTTYCLASFFGTISAFRRRPRPSARSEDAARGITLLELLLSLALASSISAVGVASVRTILRYRNIRSVATEVARILDVTAVRAQAIRADAHVVFSDDSKTVAVTFTRSTLVGTIERATPVKTSPDSPASGAEGKDRIVEHSEFTISNGGGTTIATRFGGIETAPRSMTLYATGTATPGTISFTNSDATSCAITQGLRGARTIRCA